jgi:1-acyl-sn-glycerol-3-phosphate acyltransferase
MLNGLVIVSIILLFIYYEFLLDICRFLRPGRAFEITESFARRSVRHIFTLMRTYSRVRQDFENRSGQELPERFLLLANHQSLMDIPVCIALFSARRVRFVAKRRLGTGVPFVSLILRSQGHALVERKGDATQAMRSLLRFARRCEREGTCPVIFPEGTRSLDGSVGAFHTAGVRKILAETPLPIVVAVLDGGWRIAKLADLFRNLGGSRFRVRVLSVTRPLSAKKEVLDAISKAREEIILGLATMRSESARSSKAF